MVVVCTGTMRDYSGATPVVGGSIGHQSASGAVVVVVCGTVMDDPECIVHVEAFRLMGGLGIRVFRRVPVCALLGVCAMVKLGDKVILTRGVAMRYVVGVTGVEVFCLSERRIGEIVVVFLVSAPV